MARPSMLSTDFGVGAGVGAACASAPVATAGAAGDPLFDGAG
jgi:hypothetical protein